MLPVGNMGSIGGSPGGGGGGGGAPDDAAYLLVGGVPGTLTAARTFVVSNGLQVSDLGAGATYTVSVKAADSTITVGVGGIAVGTIAESQVTGLVSDLAARALSSVQIIAGNGLSGGGDLTANRTLTVVAADSTITVGAGGVAVGTIAESQVTDLVSDLSARPTGSGGATQVAYFSGTSALTSTSSMTTDGAGTLTLSTKLVSQLVQGAVGAGGSLTLSSTASGTKGLIAFGNSAYDEVNNRLGIGRTDPVSALEVVDTGSSAVRGIVSYQASTDTNGARLQLKKSRGTVGAPTVIVNGDTIGRIAGRAYDGTQFLNVGSISFVSNGTVATNTMPTDILFNTTATNGEGTERMRIGSAGNIFLNAKAGTANTTGIAIGTAIFSPQSDVEINYSTTSTTLGDYPMIMVRNTSTTGAAEVRVALGTGGGTHYLTHYIAGGGSGGLLGTGTADSLALITTNATRILLAANGSAFTVLQAVTSGSPGGWLYTAAANTGLDAAEQVDVNWNLTRTVTNTGGGSAIATQRSYVIGAPTINSTSAQTYTRVTGTQINAPQAGTNSTFSNYHAAWLLVNDAATNTSADALLLDHNTSGTPAASFGVAILFRGQDASKTAGGDDLGRLQARWSVATSAGEISVFDFQVRGIGSAGSALTTVFQILGSATVPVAQVTDGTRKSGLSVTTTTGQVGSQSNHAFDLCVNGVKQWQITTAGNLVAAIATSLLDLSAITAGNSNFSLTLTSATPTTTFSAVNATNAAPVGFVQAKVGANTYYWPVYA